MHHNLIKSIKQMGYNPKEFEKKWQEKWAEAGIGKAVDFSEKPKKYVLIEFPYPSGNAMHIGHARNDTMMDTYSRLFRMKGYNVLYPMGWDAFGLPTENYAIKSKRQPREITDENVATFRRQLDSMGFSFDWDRQVDTTDPKYFRWTQWIFLKLFEKGLAYKTEMPINWCSKCKVGCAEEEVVDGKHERCGSPIEKRGISQWVLKITEYADRLYSDLDMVDYPEFVKAGQRNWIDPKVWIDVKYPLVDADGNEIKNENGETEFVTIATTRPDTNFGATFIVLAPEGEVTKQVSRYILPEHRKTCDEYIVATAKKTEEERISEGRKKTGAFTGLYCRNHLTDKLMPIYLADFVLPGVGTGAVVGVPGHDKRDFEFAQVFELPVIRVVRGKNGEEGPITSIDQVQELEGIMMNSGFLDGTDIHDAIEKMMDHLEAQGWGKRVKRFHLHDWVFSRQRYWGEPIPLVHCEKCGVVALPESELPLELPAVEEYEPTDDGTSPLSRIDWWVNTNCPRCGGPAKRETDTMPQWAGSSWYFMRYCDPHNDEMLADPKKLNYWLPVDIYDGGAEHITLHLLYSRFWYKFLSDIGVIDLGAGGAENNPNKELLKFEPYKVRRIHGMVLGEGGVKMSKSMGNVINPDDLIKEYGADVARLYLMFMGPYDGTCEWSSRTILGVARFAERFYDMISRGIVGLLNSGNGVGDEVKISKETAEVNSSSSSIKNEADLTSRSKEIDKWIHRMADKVENDIEQLKFNTAIAEMMKFVNEFEKDVLSRDQIYNLLLIVAPFAPHLAEQLWSANGGEFSIHTQAWVKIDKNLLVDDEIEIPVQINGKVKGKIFVSDADDENSVREKVMADERLRGYISGGVIKKLLYVKNRIVNVVI